MSVKMPVECHKTYANLKLFDLYDYQCNAAQGKRNRVHSKSDYGEVKRRIRVQFITNYYEQHWLARSREIQPESRGTHEPAPQREAKRSARWVWMGEEAWSAPGGAEDARATRSGGKSAGSEKKARRRRACAERPSSWSSCNSSSAVR